MAAARMGLSKNLKAMKFMQRKALQEGFDGGEPSSSENAFQCHPLEQWIVPNAKAFTESRKTTGDYEVNVGLAICTGVNTMGRKSYNGFNPDIEKLMQEEGDHDSSADENNEEKEGTIPALEVAERYQKLMNKQLPHKRRKPVSSEPSSKRFLKPAD